MYLKRQFVLFYSAYVRVNIQLNCHTAISSPVSFIPLHFISLKLHVTRGLTLTYAVIVLTSIVLCFPYFTVYDLDLGQDNGTETLM
jgi:hypothetical protein